MKRFLATYRNYILFSSIIFFVFSFFFLLIGSTDQTFSFYKQAVSEIKNDSLVPKSVKVYFASYNDTQVILEFSDKDLEGIESGRILAVYTYQGTDAGRLNYYFQGTTSYAFVYYGLVNNEKFPPYVTGDSLHPFVLIGVISLSFSVAVGIISRIKWRYEAINEPVNGNEIVTDINSIESITTDDQKTDEINQ